MRPNFGWLWTVLVVLAIILFAILIFEHVTVH